MPENMARNMECSFGLYFSQRVLTALIETGIPRQEAYVMVQRNAMKSWETRQPFPELIKAGLVFLEGMMKAMFRLLLR